MIDFDAMIDAEINATSDMPRHSWEWWSKTGKRKVCQKCRIRSPRGGGNYGTCEPCLDGIAAYYEAMGDVAGDEDEDEGIASIAKQRTR